MDRSNQRRRKNWSEDESSSKKGKEDSTPGKGTKFTSVGTTTGEPQVHQTLQARKRVGWVAAGCRTGGPPTSAPVTYTKRWG